MSVEIPWAKHRQHVWEERASDERLTKWVRIAALAYGMHKGNGHAVFRRDQIGLILAAVDRETGEIHRYQNVSRAIATAVEYGWLADGSQARCLIVPGHAIEGGIGGGIHTPCPVHDIATPSRRHLRAVGVANPGHSVSDYDRLRLAE